MKNLKTLAFTLSKTISTKELKKLYPKLDFRYKDSWQKVVDELQLRNNTQSNIMSITSLEQRYNDLVTEWGVVNNNDEYYLDACHLIKEQIKELKGNVINFPSKTYLKVI